MPPQHVVDGPTPAGPVIIAGAGLMGCQIGLEFALSGREVHLFDVDTGRVARSVDRTLDVAAASGVFGQAQVQAARSYVVIAPTVAELPEHASLVIEALPEDMEIKTAVLLEVIRRVPDVVIATNTSSLSINELADRIGRPAQTLGAHYWNPPLFMPLVEVTRDERSDPAAVELVRAALTAVGKTVVLVNRYVPGLIWNRLQIAILREALWLVEDGVASIDAVDTVTRLGLARRWNTTGLFASIALGGPHTWGAVARNLLPELSNARDAPDLHTLLRPELARWEGLETIRDADLARRLLEDREAQSASATQPPMRHSAAEADTDLGGIRDQ